MLHLLQIDLPAVATTPLMVVWFLLVAVLWIGYLVMEGFDYGVGMLVPFLGKTEKERRVLVNTIGPVWDGNQVWLLTAGGAMFAAFPGWYSALFSGLYLPLFLVLVGLIIRGVSFEYRSKRPNTKWRAWFDWMTAIGSFLVPLVFGVGFTNFVIGLPLVQAAAGSPLLVVATDPANVGATPYFWQLFTSAFGLPLLGGIVLVVAFLFHGSIYLVLKTRGELQARAKSFAAMIGIVAIVGGAIFLVIQNLAHPTGLLGWVFLVVAAVGLILAWLMIRGGRPGVAFIGTCVAILGVAGGIFTAIFGNLGFTDAATGAPYADMMARAASSELTLTIMVVAACVFVPIVLAYTVWSYWTFRHPLSVANIPDEALVPAN